MTSNVGFGWESRVTRQDSFDDSLGDPLGNECRRIRTARLILAANRARDEHFGLGTFGDPAWEMLLILYLRESGGACSTMTGLVSAQEAPGSTATRWLNHLCQQRAMRRDHRAELGMDVVELTASGRWSVERYLDALGAS